MTAVVKSRFKLVFFVPPENRQAVQSAIFSTGAGKYPGPGAYSECAWATLGTGQFRPGNEAKPHIGEVGKVEEVQEYRVEILCHGDDVIRAAVRELKKTHPYEEPAYEVHRLEDL
ncbi:hypothetical protein AMS68_001021 [Peltaster fructicola]|uniref:ATP phosphoribosyltransferase n=1 Tax=Peltaster fructicola TaxID=286661 RepID=A0A6H0XLA0_9PEZI|nr:hypothetical protein AMS68_001021 [Peltaster fructicola]